MSENNNNISIFDALKEGIKDIDANAWPGVFMFLALIAVESAANIIASLPDFGWIVAGLVGLLFGVFMACWHIITERTKNSKKQQSTAEWLVNITAGASIVLLVVNLIRLSSGGNVDWEIALDSFYPTAKDVSAWDIIAVIVVGISFTSHLFGYLTWHKSDNYRQSKRIHSGKMNEIGDQELKAQRSLRVAEVKLLALDAELNKTKQLQEQYKHLPANILKNVIEEARKEIREAFEKKYDVDIDDDGHKGKPQNSPQLQTARQFGADAPQPQAVKQYTIDELLEHVGKSKAEVIALLKSYGLTDPNKAYKEMRGYGMLPDDLSHGNFARLFNENFAPNSQGGK